VSSGDLRRCVEKFVQAFWNREGISRACARAILDIKRMLLLHVGEMAVVCGGGSEASILQNAGRKNSKVWLVVLAWCQGAFPAGVFTPQARFNK
jgi:hypothetical protein